MALRLVCVCVWVLVLDVQMCELHICSQNSRANIRQRLCEALKWLQVHSMPSAISVKATSPVLLYALMWVAGRLWRRETQADLNTWSMGRASVSAGQHVAFSRLFATLRQAWLTDCSQLGPPMKTRNLDTWERRGKLPMHNVPFFRLVSGSNVMHLLSRNGE